MARILATFLFVSFFSVNVFSAEIGLLGLYQRAQSHDALFAAARSSLEAGREYKNIGLAGLLPSVAVSLESSQVETRRESWPQTGVSRFKYDSRSTSLRLSQPIFDLAKFAGYREGDARSQLAEVVFQEVNQDLLLRLAEAYFSYRLALDTLDLAKSQSQAIRYQKNQAEHLFKAGVATLTDVEESRAKQHLAEADELAARNLVAVRRKELERIVGPILDGELAIGEVLFTAMPPEPNDLEHWLSAARDRSLKVLSQELQVIILGYQVDQQRASHFPTVSLVGSYTSTDRPSFNTSSQDSSVVGLQLSMSLFEGGRVNAQTRQAVANLERARHETLSAKREAEVKGTQAFLDVVNGIARISAYEQAEKSSEIALKGMLAGQQAGLRTNSDVLNAYQQIYSVRRDLQRERYDYLQSRLRLKAVVGELTLEEFLTLVM